MERAEAEAIIDGERETAIALLVRIDGLVEANRRLEARVGELEERLRQNSRNSSLPPSRDPPAAVPRPQKPPSGRRPGGQPGHEGKSRPLLPLERVDRVVEHWPSRCAHCARELGEGERLDAAAPQRHQVFELPPIAVEVAEHRLHRARCPGCGGETRAELPPELAGSAFGPRLQAAVATLSVRNRLSRRDVSELAQDLFGCPLSVGAVDAICQRASAALAEPHRELHEALKGAPVVNADETGWKLAGDRRWLWGGVTPKLAAFLISASRGQDSARQLLGEGFEGVCVSDRWSGYNHLRQRALCWSHLVRDFRKLEERGGVAGEIGQAALAVCERLFAAWHSFRAERRDRGWLRAQVGPLARELRSLLERGASEGDAKTKRFCRNLLALWPALWTFVEQDGVEPTNNAAERGLRSAVIYRKLSFGNQSEEGARFVERMLSVAHTCRLQKRSLFNYLIDAFEARARGQPAPSLVPT